MKSKLGPIAVACAALTGCNTMGIQGGSQWNALPGFGGTASETLTATAVANPCLDAERQKEAMSKSIAGGLMGAAGGALIGALLDHAAGNKNNQLAKVGLVAGMVAGAMRGYNNGVDSSRRQCDVYKAAMERNAQIALATVTVGSEVVGEMIANPVAGFFLPGTDRLTPSGLEYFKAQARQYTEEVQLAGYESAIRDAGKDQRTAPLSTFRVSAGQREQVVSRWRNMRIMLTGHVDDSTDDALQLSESRAKAVAEVFRSTGVPSDVLVYQGVGASLPVADNNTVEGREANNRVEIAVFYDERTLTPYQEQRETDHRLFSKPSKTRSAESGTTVAGSTPASASAAGDREPKPASATVAAVHQKPADPQLGIEFGGVPLTQERMDVAEAVGPVQPSKSALMAWLPFGSAIAASNLAAPNCLADDPGRYRKAAAKRLSDDRELGAKAPLSSNAAYLNIVRRSYAGTAGEHFVELKNVSVARSGELAETPTFNVFKGFTVKTDAERAKTGNPEIATQPVAFSVRGERGVLIRQFFEGREGIICMDVVLPNELGATTAKKTSLVYSAGGVRKVASPVLGFQRSKT